jgi:polyribonucleotide 5'-hydroxyl-kinase
MLKDVLKGKPNVEIVKPHKSGGVVPRNSKYQQQMRIYRTWEYFYGLTNKLSPHANVVNYGDLETA